MDRGEGAQQLLTSEEVQDSKSTEVEKSFPNVDSQVRSSLTGLSLGSYWNFLLLPIFQLTSKVFILVWPVPVINLLRRVDDFSKRVKQFHT